MLLQANFPIAIQSKWKSQITEAIKAKDVRHLSYLFMPLDLAHHNEKCLEVFGESGALKAKSN